MCCNTSARHSGIHTGLCQINRQCTEHACFRHSRLHAGNLNGGLGGQDDSSSDWEELSEEGSEAALEVHGLPPGQNLLDIAAAAASAHDYVDGISKVQNLAPWNLRHPLKGVTLMAGL